MKEEDLDKLSNRAAIEENEYISDEVKERIQAQVDLNIRDFEENDVENGNLADILGTLPAY